VDEQRTEDLDAYLDEVLIGGREERVIEIVDYRPAWAERFGGERARIDAALGSIARSIDHVGSTAVPGLGAKPIVDIMVTVDDPDDESSYLPQLEQAGYVLRVREPQHRMLRTPELEVQVHIWTAGSDDERRHLIFRVRLRSSAEDRAEYERTKRELAGQHRDVNHYANAKGALIGRIIENANREAAPPR